jgi:hypothetical protein
MFNSGCTLSSESALKTTRCNALRGSDVSADHPIELNVQQRLNTKGQMIDVLKSQSVQHFLHRPSLSPQHLPAPLQASLIPEPRNLSFRLETRILVHQHFHPSAIPNHKNTHSSVPLFRINTTSRPLPHRKPVSLILGYIIALLYQ